MVTKALLAERDFVKIRDLTAQAVGIVAASAVLPWLKGLSPCARPRGAAGTCRRRRGDAAPRPRRRPYRYHPQLPVWEGGGEYNVARGLRRCFGLRTAVVTALADNPIGRLVEDLLLQGGVDISHLRWAPFDGIGRSVRNGLNFTERGLRARAALGCSDRANSATSQLQPENCPGRDLRL